MIGKRRKTLLAVLICVLALVLSLGILSACGGDNASTEHELAANAQWYYGTTAPAESLGTTGDHYLNTESLTSYVKTANGAWELTDLYSGTEAPDNEVGDLGDLYLDTDEGVLYQKGDTRWSIVLTIKGEKGRDGVMWFSGTVHPKDAPEGTVKDALAGDFYIDYSTFNVYQLKEDGTWNELGSVKGDAGKDSIHFTDGEGAPEGKAELSDPQDRDLYLGKFYGKDGNGAGSRLYRYNAEKGEWVILMDTVKEKEILIYTYEELCDLAADNDTYNGYAGLTVRLKTNIDFSDLSTASEKGRRSAPRAAEWLPIGSSKVPFKGTFDGEGHTISNFTVTTNDAGARIGFFGYVEDATIEHLHFEKASVSVSGEGSFGAVVVGQAMSDLTVRDVTVTGSTVEATDESAKVGSLVGSSDGTVTVQEVEVEVNDAEGTEGGKEGSDLVGSGEVNFEGNNEVSYPVVEGFVEKHYKTDGATNIICEITSLAGLKAFHDSVNGVGDFEGKADTYENKTVNLMTDIDLTGETWTSINGFKGTFDGKNHTVSNMKVVGITTPNASNGENCGFFRAIEGAVKNLKFVKAEVRNGYYAAVLAGSFSGDCTIENVTIEDSKVHGSHFVSGLVSYANGNMTISIKNVTVKNSVVDAVQEYDGVDCKPASGIIGHVQNSPQITIENCTVESTAISAWQYVGGLIGRNAGSGTLTLKGNTVKDSTLIVDHTPSETLANKGENSASTANGVFVGNFDTAQNEAFKTEEGGKNVAENVTVTLVVNSGDELTKAIEAVNNGTFNGITFGSDVTIDGVSKYNKGLLQVNANAVIDLNGKTLSAKDTNDAAGYIISVGGAATSFEIKNGTVNYNKLYDDYFQEYAGAFLDWSTSDAMARSLTIEDLQIIGAGQALNLKNGWIRDNENRFTVTVNDCSFVGDITLICNIDLTATNLNFGKLSASSGSTNIELTGGSFAGSAEVSEGTDIYSGFIAGDKFFATGTKITGEIEIRACEKTKFTDCTFESRLYVYGFDWTIIKLNHSKCDDIFYVANDTSFTRYIVIIDENREEEIRGKRVQEGLDPAWEYWDF